MATIKYGIPGIGGLLGMCAVCGNNFAVELMLKEPVDSIRISIIDADLPVHTKCANLVMSISNTDSDWRRLPDGPLRQSLAEAEIEATA